MQSVNNKNFNDAKLIIDQLILEQPQNVDFLNIDAENNDYKVLLGINFKNIKPKMICIEDNKFNFNLIHKSKIYNYLKKNIRGKIKK